MIEKNALRFFALLARPPLAIVASHVAVLVWAACLAWVMPQDLRAPYVVLLFCQAFGAATGFYTRARRGHFDQVLAASAPRTAVGAAHAIASMAPGLAAWLALAAIETRANAWSWPLGLTPAALTALAYVSALGWAASLPFSRYSSGVAWMVLAIGLAAWGKLLALRGAYLGNGGTWVDALKAAGAALVFPGFLVGEPLPPAPIVQAVVLGGTLAAFTIGLWLIRVFDFALEERS